MKIITEQTLQDVWHIIDSCPKDGSKDADARLMYHLCAVPVKTKEGAPTLGHLWPEDSSSWNFCMLFRNKDMKWLEGVKQGEKTGFMTNEGLMLMNSLRMLPLTSDIGASYKLYNMYLGPDFKLNVTNEKGYWEGTLNGNYAIAKSEPLLRTLLFAITRNKESPVESSSSIS